MRFTAFSLPMLLLLAGCGVTAGQAAIGAAGVAVGSTMEARGMNPVPPRADATANRVANNIRDNIKATADHVEEWWNYEPEVKYPNPVPNTYCYRSYGDVLCYRAPMPGWEHRLVGYQGTYADAPPPPMMEPLPGKSGEKMLPANRVAAAQPVFLEMPEEIKEEKKIEDLAEPAPENLREVSDPALAPQL